MSAVVVTQRNHALANPGDGPPIAVPQPVVPSVGGSTAPNVIPAVVPTLRAASIVPARSYLPAIQRERPIVAQVAGLRGPAGRDGQGAIEMNFAYGDASPEAITTALAGKFVRQVELAILTPFDGVGAALRVGDGANHTRLMDAGDSDPASVGTYTAAPGYRYGANTVLALYITPGAGANQGAGVLTIELEE